MARRTGIWIGLVGTVRCVFLKKASAILLFLGNASFEASARVYRLLESPLHLLHPFRPIQSLYPPLPKRVLTNLGALLTGSPPFPSVPQ